ncbi:DEAD/DEAH box helicase [Kribbella caucasensis]|nr:DEAD/DEAH box helicase family protein [Kribbella sp. VKM Ac-2527]
MADHYSAEAASFRLFSRPGVPSWREAQLGALGALLAHWSIHDSQAALVAIPTGSGKSAIATAVPYLLRARRVLVVVPSKQLREQLAASFEGEDVLRRIDALDGECRARPKVVEVRGRKLHWEDLAEADVVVALPDSISPVHHEGHLPPRDLFDVIVVDEAHHAPAPTWRAILDYWTDARGVLLSATPRRRDGQRLPGDVVFHYPLRRAIEDGAYKPVVSDVLPMPVPGTKSACDDAIVARILQLLAQPEHGSSALLVRAESERRARELAEIYSAAGQPVEVLVSRLPEREKSRIVEGLQTGSIRAVAVVGMLGEGFDLARLRLAAYHDKHKSLSSTVQLIGRLVRPSPRFPQPSVLVTVQDTDVYPALRGAVKSLWEEDSDWSVLLPRIADDQIERTVADRRFAERLEAAPAELAVDAIHPMVAARVYEARQNDWKPCFVNGDLPDAIAVGRMLRGKQIYYASVTPDQQTLMVITQAATGPRWHMDPGLDSHEYELHLITWVPAKKSHEQGLLLVNGENGQVTNELLKALGVEREHLRIADPALLQGAFDTLPRLSVSNVGVRNTYAGGRGAPTYKTFAGSGVDRGLREADTAQAAIGHAMAQVEEENSTYTTGIATAKAKFWEARNVPLRLYQDLLNDFAERYWSTELAANPLLPDVARGLRLAKFPSGDVVLVELNPDLIGRGWTVANGTPLETVDIELDTSAARTADVFPLKATDQLRNEVIWRGHQDVLGDFHDAQDTPPCIAQRGWATRRSFSELLDLQPPNIYFYDGTTVHGGLKYEPVSPMRTLPSVKTLKPSWAGVDITAETDATAAEHGNGISVQSAVADQIAATPTSYARRWILGNDGGGELADVIVLEVDHGRRARIALWHVKPAGTATPAVRVSEMQVVVAQAIKSRRWLTDLSLWEEMGKRLTGEASPRLTIIEGSERLLRVLLGINPAHRSWALNQNTRLVRGEVVIVQPGLSWAALQNRLGHADLSAQQVRDLLAVFDDAVGQRGGTTVVCSD